MFLKLDRINTIFIVFCFIFIVLPKMVQSRASIHIIKFVLLISTSSIIRGITFCTEIVIQNRFLSLILKHIGINQLWNGAAPSFSTSAKIISSLGLMFVVNKIWFIRRLNKISNELILCTIK